MELQQKKQAAVAPDSVLFDAEVFDKECKKANNLLALFRNTLKDAKNTLAERFREGVNATTLVSQQAWVVDQLLTRAWNEFLSADSDDIALVAVGGYGRGQLHPGSDIDILILLRDENHKQHQDFIEKFLVFLWDIGLEIGHSVRSVSECQQQARADITIATNLMESRLLRGKEQLYLFMKTMTDPDHIWPERDFFKAKFEEQCQRYSKYDETGYKLEPNIKESPGGLRDIQIIDWVAKRHFRTNRLSSLVEHGFLTRSEYDSLKHGQDFLWRIRFALHLITGRGEDRLLFDYQKTIAEDFGYKDQDHRLAVEGFMRDYYKTVMELRRLNEMLLQLFEEAILFHGDPAKRITINKRFQTLNHFIEVTDKNIFKRYPFALLEMFLLIQQNQDIKGVRASTIRLVRNHCYLIDDEFRKDIRNRSLFLEIIRQPNGLTHELRRMNLYGVLAAYLPDFGMITGLMQYDLFHIYTVDEHTLMVVRNLRRFSVPEFRDEYPLCSEIHQRLPKPEILYLAGLFHDIGKGRNGNHSSIGSDEAFEFCRLHDMSQHDARFVSWLVRNHLIFSMTAQKQDISDPEIITAFARKIGDQAHLDYLYLLTVADIRGTNPALWNSWRDSLLKELYRSTRRALARGLEKPIDKEERITETRNIALNNLAREGIKNKNISKEKIMALWETIDDDYFLQASADEVSWHSAAILSTTDNELPLILARHQEKRGATEIFVYARDADNLFAIITRTLDKLGLSIVDARIITSMSGFTLDSFIVLDGTGASTDNNYRYDEIINSLRAQLSSPEASFASSTRRLPRQLKHFPIPTEITFSTDKDNTRTIMELVTADRPGLLSRVGQALIKCGVRLRNAKITTLGAHVEDIFILTDHNNLPINDQETFSCLRDNIKKFLAQ